MFTKVSVLIPTRHRVERLEKMLASYDSTTEDADSELVFRVDDDDEETEDFLLQHPYDYIVGPRKGGYANLSSFFNEMAEQATGDVLMVGNDDMVFQTNGWSTILLKAANEFPDGLFDLGVSTLNETHFPFATVSKRVVDRLGFFWDPRIFWGDIFWRDVMHAFGRCVMIPDIRIDHEWAGFQPDKVFLETRTSKSQIEGNPAYWTDVHAPAVAEAVERLRGLLE